jgi:toxin CcdB
MIRQFDVYPNPSRRGREGRPYVVVVQSDLLGEVATRIVAPLVVSTNIDELPRLTPAVVVEGQRLYFFPIEIFPMPLRLLRVAVANLEEERYRLISALDLVLTGV